MPYAWAAAVSLAPTQHPNTPNRSPLCRGTLLPVLSVLPLVGPALYLLLRPKADLSK